MSGCQHITLMAEYNAWMNEKLYAAAATLAPAVLAADRKAFFGSIIGTLNHSVSRGPDLAGALRGAPGSAGGAESDPPVAGANGPQ